MAQKSHDMCRDSYSWQAAQTRTYNTAQACAHLTTIFWLLTFCCPLRLPDGSARTR